MGIFGFMFNEHEIYDNDDEYDNDDNDVSDELPDGHEPAPRSGTKLSSGHNPHCSDSFLWVWKNSGLAKIIIFPYGGKNLNFDIKYIYICTWDKAQFENDIGA